MNTLLNPAPELRAKATLPASGELSPEAQDGRFEGKTEKLHGNRNGGCPVFEQPWHQHAVKCLALRMTYEETASFCGVSKDSVVSALRAPFFQARLRDELARTTTPLEDLFRDAGVKAFHKIVEVMEDVKTPKATQLASAREIIDRCLGKAPQTIKHEETESISDPVALVEHLKLSNAALRKQLPN